MIKIETNQYDADISCTHDLPKKTITVLKKEYCNITLELCKNCQQKPQFKYFSKLKEDTT